MILSFRQVNYMLFKMHPIPSQRVDLNGCVYLFLPFADGALPRCAGRYQEVVWEVCQKSGCNSGRLSAEHTDEIRLHRHLFHSHWVPTRNGILRRKTNKSWSEEHSRDSCPIPCLASTHTIQFNVMGVIKVLINNYWIN